MTTTLTQNDNNEKAGCEQKGLCSILAHFSVKIKIFLKLEFSLKMKWSLTLSSTKFTSK